MDEITLARRVAEVVKSGPGIYGWADMTPREAEVATEALRRQGVEDATIVALAPEGDVAYFYLGPDLAPNE